MKISKQKLRTGIFIPVSGLKGEPVTIKINGLVLDSSNSKTGAMVQSIIAPSAWYGQGFLLNTEQKSVCGDCPFSSEGPLRCYTHNGYQRLGIHSSLRSSKPELFEWSRDEILHALSGKAFRFGTYGEPVLFGEEWVRDIVSVVSMWTGYTHQWRDIRFQWASQYLMASVHSPDEAAEAHSLGWRTFRASHSQDIAHGEIVCPASKEAGYRTTCIECGLCSGGSSAGKNIFINEH